MTKTVCPPNVWTDIPAAGGDMLLEMRGRGCYVDTTGTKPADYAEGYALASLEAMVIKDGLPVAVHPGQSVVHVNAYSIPV